MACFSLQATSLSQGFGDRGGDNGKLLSDTPALGTECSLWGKQQPEVLLLLLWNCASQLGKGDQSRGILRVLCPRLEPFISWLETGQNDGAPLPYCTCLGLSLSNRYLWTGWKMLMFYSSWEKALHLGAMGRWSPLFLAVAIETRASVSLSWEGRVREQSWFKYIDIHLC